MTVNARLTRPVDEIAFDGRCLDCCCSWQGMLGQANCPECESSRVWAAPVLDFLDLGPGVIQHGCTVVDYFDGECRECGCVWIGLEGTACPDCEGENTACFPANKPGFIVRPGRFWPGHDR